MENTKVIFEGASTFGEVQLFSDDKKVGKMNISVVDGRLRVYHTEVNPEYERRGFAELLLGQLVSHAKENKLRIIPLCPYVHAQFKLHPESYTDVWSIKAKNNNRYMEN